MFGASTLSIGDTTLMVRPVADDRVDELVGMVAGIDGVDRVLVEAVDGLTARLVAHSTHPIPLERELRAAAAGAVASCALVDGILVVELSRPPGAVMPSLDVSPPETERLLLADRRLRAAVQAGLDSVDDLSIIVFDLDQRYVLNVGGAPSRFGMTFSDIRGRTAREVVRPDVWPILGPAFQRALEGDACRVEFPGPQYDTTLAAAFRPLYDENQGVIGGLVVVSTVDTGRRQEEMVAVLEVTFDDAPIAQALIDGSGRWLRVNAELQRLLGGLESDIVGRSALDGLSDDDARALLRRLADLVAGRRDRDDRTLLLRRVDGTFLQAPGRLTAIRSGDRCPGMVLQLLPDVAQPGADGSSQTHP